MSVNKLVEDAIKNESVVVIPSDDGKSCFIGDFEIENHKVCEFLFSLGVSMMEESGSHYSITLDDSLRRWLSNDDVMDVSYCRFSKSALM